MTNRYRILAPAALALGLLTTTPATAEAPTPPHTDAYMTTPCKTEDSVNCYWDAKEQGNGQGHSYWSIRVNDHRVAIVYWNERYNLKHGHTYRSQVRIRTNCPRVAADYQGDPCWHRVIEEDGSTYTTWGPARR